MFVWSSINDKLLCILKLQWINWSPKIVSNIIATLLSKLEGDPIYWKLVLYLRINSFQPSSVFLGSKYRILFLYESGLLYLSLPKWLELSNTLQILLLPCTLLLLLLSPSSTAYIAGRLAFLKISTQAGQLWWRFKVSDLNIKWIMGRELTETKE